MTWPMSASITYSSVEPSKGAPYFNHCSTRAATSRVKRKKQANTSPRAQETATRTRLELEVDEGLRDAPMEHHEVDENAIHNSSYWQGRLFQDQSGMPRILDHLDDDQDGGVARSDSSRVSAAGPGANCPAMRDTKSTT